MAVYNLGRRLQVVPGFTPLRSEEVKMARVIRLYPGDSSTVEKIGLSLKQAKELAARLSAVGEPPGCSWCVGLDDDEEETDDHT